MSTRDGVELVADLYRPVGDGPFPVLVRRTPYGRQLNDLAEPFNEAHYFASHGYLVAVQDTRGRFDSSGTWYPFLFDGRDGYDSIEWAAGLDGSSGRVGTFGQSYGCMVQYLTAVLRPPHLAACVGTSGGLMAFENYWYQRGVLELNWTLSYFVNMAEAVLAEQGREADLAALTALKVDPGLRFSPLNGEAMRHLPISDWIDRLGDAASFLRDVLYHDVDGFYWWTCDLRWQLDNIDVPMLHLGSWYDLFAADTPKLYEGVRDRGLTATTRRNQALFMGPWAHLLPYNQPTTGGTGDIDFGPEAARFLPEMSLRWFDHYLKSEEPSELDLPQSPVTIFVMGENRWRDESEWPLDRTEYTPYFLHSDGAAAGGDGALSTTAPGDEPADTYRFDPDDPAPTTGGHFVGGGVADQRDRQARADVLVYTSDALETELEITGPVSATVYVSSSTVDADFVVCLSDVRPDGYCQNLLETIARGRFRDSYTEPQLMVPGEVYELSLDLGNVSHVLFAGHRLRVDVTSSSFPRWERNLGTGERLLDGSGRHPVVAEQTVWHHSDRPSHVRLPVIPR